MPSTHSLPSTHTSRGLSPSHSPHTICCFFPCARVTQCVHTALVSALDQRSSYVVPLLARTHVKGSPPFTITSRGLSSSPTHSVPTHSVVAALVRAQPHTLRGVYPYTDTQKLTMTHITASLPLRGHTFRGVCP